MDTGTSRLIAAEGFDNSMGHEGTYYSVPDGYFTTLITGRSGEGLAMRMEGQGSFWGGLPATAQSYMGAAIRIPAWGAPDGHGNSRVLMTFSSNYELFLGGTGKLRVTHNQGTVLIGETTDPVISPNVWCYIEVSPKLFAVDGNFEVRVNGVTVLSVARDTSDTAGGGWLLMGWINDTGDRVVPVDYDDCYVANHDGGPDTFLGDVQVKNIYPNGAGSYTELTPLDSTSLNANWQNVDETVLNPIRDYNWSATTGQLDAFTLTPNFPIDDGASVKGIFVWSSSSHDGAPFYGRGGRVLVKSGSSLDHGPYWGGSEPYLGRFRDAFDLDPSTGLPWTIATINALEVGVEVGAQTAGTGVPTIHWMLEYLHVSVVSEVVYLSLGDAALDISESSEAAGLANPITLGSPSALAEDVAIGVAELSMVERAVTVEDIAVEVASLGLGYPAGILLSPIAKSDNDFDNGDLATAFAISSDPAFATGEAGAVSLWYVFTAASTCDWLIILSAAFPAQIELYAGPVDALADDLTLIAATGPVDMGTVSVQIDDRLTTHVQGE